MRLLHKFWTITCLILFLFGAGALYSQSNPAMPTYSQEKYEQAWKAIDSLEQEGLWRSALDQVNLLYERARGDNNPAQVIKTLIYRTKFEMALQEDSMEKGIARLEEEVRSAAFPVKPVLQSMLGELYQNYLDQNIWRLADRTEVAAGQSDDIQTWTIAQLNARIVNLFDASVRDERLGQVAIDQFDAITTEAQQVAGLRPSLYDFLVHRAIDQFRNERNYLTEPAYQFELRDAAAFADAAAFIGHRFTTRDTGSFQFKALLLFQDLLRRHGADKDPAALIDADLKRLEFVYEKAVLDGKEDQYRSALDRLRVRYAAHPSVTEIDAQLAQWYMQKGGEYHPFRATEHQWALKTAKEICDRAIKAFPQAFGASRCRELLRQIQVRSIDVQAEEVNLPGQPILARIDYRNLAKAAFRVVIVTQEDRDSLERINTADKLRYLLGKKTERQWQIDLPPSTDYQTHATEMAIDALPAGSYALLIGLDGRFQTEAGPAGLLFFHVSAIAALQRTGDGEQSEFLIVNRQSGAPLAGVQAEFFVNQYNRSLRRQERRRVGSAVSDSEGILRPSLSEDNYYLVKFTHGDDVLFTGDGFSNYTRFYRQEGVQQMTNFFLDRAIYRPGQTVYFKGIALEREGNSQPRLLTNRPVTVTFFDVNHQEVDKVELRTNAYGTFHGSFRAPEGGLRGQMSLEASIGGAVASFRVEEYKRPRFEVTFDPLTADYKLGDEVTVTGKAAAFAGSAVDGAMVQYRVVREVRYPWWPYWRGGYFFPPTRSQSMEIANGVTTTNTEGAFTVTFPAIPDPSVRREDKPSFIFTVYADVTDITGETRSKEKAIQLAYLGLEAALELPAQIDRGQAPALGIRTTNLDGQPIETQGQVTIYRLEAPQQVFINRYWERPDQRLMPEADFRRRFPQYAYQGEDEPSNWARGPQVWNGAFNTGAESSLTFDPASWPVGHYEAHLTTTDREGNAIETKKFFLLYDSRAGQAPANILGWQQGPDQPLEPGDRAAILLATGAGELQVRYELERDQSIVSGQWLSVRNWRELPYQIQEADRGNVHVLLTYVRYNRAFSEVHTLQVPWSNKQLHIEYSTFRDKLQPGQQEEWRLKISGPAGDRVAAEMVATLYDASLDQFAVNNWYFDPFPTNSYVARRWSAWNFGAGRGEINIPYVSDPEETPGRQYRSLNWFNLFRYGFGGHGAVQYRALAADAIMMESAAPLAEKNASPGDMDTVALDGQSAGQGGDQAPPEVQVRTNLKETVFFLPELGTDADGNVTISFTMNEALTRWKFLGLAHTKDLAYALTQREVVTQKELMVLPNAPRFVREGDELEFTAKVSNLTEVSRAGTATLQLFDALTMQPVDAQFSNQQAAVTFEAGPGQSARVAWKLRVPAGKTSVLLHRVIAQSGPYSDGEEDALPVLSNRLLVTESMPLPLGGRERKTFTFDRLLQAGQSSTLQPHALTLEFTSNPAWYAVKALPYIMEYPHECAEQIFSRLYANSLAGAVVDAHPRLRDVFEQWRRSGGLQSELMRNQELKAVLLEETPWVMEAQSEEKQRQNIALLFDLDRMKQERATALRKLEEMQLPNGGFGWFPGGSDNWFITQYIVEGLGRLRLLGVRGIEEEGNAGNLLRQAMVYIDERLSVSYQELQTLAREGKIKLEDDHLSQLAMHYLYARSYFEDVPREAGAEEAYQYFLGQAEKYWLDKGLYHQGTLAMAFHRAGREDSAQRIVRSLRERALRSDELGMYWKYQRGWFWWELPIETHALMMEVFGEVAHDAESVEALQVWLLKNKQTNHWSTTKATAAAVYALLRDGEGSTGDLLADSKPVAIDFPGLRKKQYQEQLAAAAANAEAGTGYYKVTWTGPDIEPAMAELRLKNPNRGIAWGSLYWQYFEDLDKITTFEETPLQLKKQLFRQEPSDRGPQLVAVAPGVPLAPGDLLTVRIELRVDRDMEYVHMKDLRASGLEPVNVLSQYKWQGGLGYYESTGDAATHFFFDVLPRGAYVFEYPLRVNLPGDFSNGVTTIQCMYAPEFTSHSEGARIRVASEEN